MDVSDTTTLGTSGTPLRCGRQRHHYAVDVRDTTTLWTSRTPLRCGRQGHHYAGDVSFEGCWQQQWEEGGGRRTGFAISIQSAPEKLFNVHWTVVEEMSCWKFCFPARGTGLARKPVHLSVTSLGVWDGGSGEEGEGGVGKVRGSRCRDCYNK